MKNEWMTSVEVIVRRIGTPTGTISSLLSWAPGTAG
jgi:hypothetical protein